ncbi:hypothetical protein PoB_000413200 [Plakobranchus ocellatus]|uniref:Uncharacterized protein n=1 Tax=Plakobranchus ocellatus TaxID=259542 RepID=A0AAV3Y4H4_9GAST|nr:hypothetical protein PoB_000413200 [Plakobranchus ocellatus]
MDASSLSRSQRMVLMALQKTTQIADAEAKPSTSKFPAHDIDHEDLFDLNTFKSEKPGLQMSWNKHYPPLHFIWQQQLKLTIGVRRWHSGQRIRSEIYRGPLLQARAPPLAPWPDRGLKA